jgi:hypothetical protein
MVNPNQAFVREIRRFDAVQLCQNCIVYCDFNFYDFNFYDFNFYSI